MSNSGGASSSGPRLVRLPIDETLRLRPIDLASPSESGVDCADPESQRALTAAARAVAREMGRQAAREYFAEVIGTQEGR